MTDKDDQLPKKVLDLCDEALKYSAADRAAFVARACGDDQKLRASVDTVLFAIDSAGSFLDTDQTAGADGAAMIGREFANYRILDKLGEGGMGAVYLAERNEPDYRQLVAIKMVRGHLLAPELRKRFNAERQILAGLNHPYIARLIDGGTTVEGSPYLVMEYVDGAPIDEYCDNQRLDVHARIRLLRKVTMAVQSAHRNLVVHRDLKPSNVLVTRDGIPKLLDFGIAKLLQPDGVAGSADTTVFGQQAMTPDYASPEQILDGHVTTASDVYTLGVLAYQLLCGERPYELPKTDHRRLLQTVETLTVPRPSTRIFESADAEAQRDKARKRATTPEQLARTLAGDLDTILLKALHRDPDRRYESVGAFSADLGRYSAGLPVEARDDSLGYRISRFVGRHKVGVAMATGALVLLMTALSVTSYNYLRAEAARADADERFNQVRALAKTMMFDIYDDLDKLPGTFTARERIAATAQAYLEALSNAEAASPDVQLEAAEGYARLAWLFNRQAVTDPSNRDISRQAWEKALSLLTELVDTHPKQADVLRSLGQLQSDLGNSTLYISNDVDAARPHFDAAFAALGAAAKLAPDDERLILARMLARLRYADSFKWENKFDDAETLLVELIDDIVAARERLPEHAELTKTLGDANHLLGEVRSFNDKLEEATGNYEAALALFREALEIGGPNRKINSAMFVTHWSYGYALSDLGRLEEAIDNFDAALEIITLRLARDPDDASAQRRLTILRATKAGAVAKLGQVDEALALMFQTNAWFERQAVADPDTPGSHRSIAVNYQATADILEGTDRRAETCDWWQRALAKWQEIDTRFGLSKFDVEQPGILRDKLAGCERAGG